MKISIARAGQVLSKFFFCLRVAGDPGTFLRLLRQSKILDRYQKRKVSHGYDPTANTLSYSIRFHSAKRIIYLRTYAGDIRMFYEIFWEEAYRLPPALVKGSMVGVDAGANIGMTALYFSIICPGSRIFCIEPDADNFRMLRQNLAAERERVVLIEAALYDRDGRVGFGRERWAYNSRIDERDDRDGPDENSGTVKAVRLDSLLDQYRLEWVDLLKIDIEGAEDKVFSGGGGWLSRVAMILIEVHRPASMDRIAEKLSENGFCWRPWGRAGAGASLFLASKVEMA
jgi:FkbM family methyltransferase